MRCLRQIAGIKWQDMLPNTEVLEQCGTWRIEFHIKREQLRWSGHQVRMNDDRIPKALFYGKPKTGCRTRGGQRKRYKGVIKSTLKSCSIPLNTWETTATNRPLWRHTCHTVQQDFEQKRLQIIKDRRTQRKNGQPPHLRSYMTVLSVNTNALRASACTVTRESTTDTGRDPSFDGSLHPKCRKKYVENRRTVKPAMHISNLPLPTCWRLLFQFATQCSHYVYILHQQ